MGEYTEEESIKDDEEGDDEEESEEETDTDTSTEVDGVVLMNDEGFPDCEDEELDPVMKELLNNNMKFNIIFTVGDPGMQPMQSMDFDEDYEEEEFESGEETEETEETEEEEESDIKLLKNKLAKDATDEEWEKLAEEQEKEMRKNGTYYPTKYKKGDKILYKKKSWSDFKKGIVTNINLHKLPK